MNALEKNILDVTLLPPREKHPTIFRRFEALLPGQDLVINNDHDPKPLYYQMIGELGNVFQWEYLEEGPENWSVKLTKNAKVIRDETIGDLVAKDLRKVEVFKKYGLDFCCGGNKTIKDACDEQGIDVKIIEQELLSVNEVTNNNPFPYNEWSIDFLADFIVNTHHQYVRKSLPEIRAYAIKVAQVHGEKHPELIPLQQIVESINSEIVSHMQKEENILFPYIKKLVETEKINLKIDKVAIKAPIGMMIAEHESVGDMLKEIRALTKDYTLPEDACATYGLLFRMLDEFESDLHIHIHLENNILFPKAEKMEKSLLINT